MNRLQICFYQRTQGSTTLGSVLLDEPTGAPHPGFPVRLGEVGELHAAFLDESRTRGRWLEQRTGNPGISLVFREMWDSTAVICEDSRSDANLKGRIRGIPHLAKNKRDMGHPSVLVGERFR
jgi:hypothetical protein